MDLGFEAAHGLAVAPLDEPGAHPEHHPAEAGDDHDAFIAALHARKTAIFTDLIADGSLALRPGVQRIVDEAKARGITVISGWPWAKRATR